MLVNPERGIRNAQDTPQGRYGALRNFLDGGSRRSDGKWKIDVRVLISILLPFLFDLRIFLELRMIGPRIFHLVPQLFNQIYF